MAQLDPSAIGALYDAYGPMVFRRCRDILGDEQAALDATQDVFVRALVSAADFRGEASPVTWLYRISTNLCLNRIRDARGRRRKLDAARDAVEGEEAADAPAGVFGGAGMVGPRGMERQALVRSLLERVDEETRRVAIYYYFDGMTHEEIGALVGLSRPTVRKRLEHFTALSRRQLRLGDGSPAVGLALLAILAAHGLGG